ncbi:hypothetical protein DACRYDRAFT_40663, partial [Dacryopinax primogenitus]
FGRCRMHNEQLVVHPCGIVLPQATFYGSKGMSSVTPFLMSIFPTCKAMPEVLVFDNNCTLGQYLHFKETALVVDVFHYKMKHADNNVYCSTHCNLASFPELYDPASKTWMFNSLACKQTNAWICKYQGQLQEMSAIRFKFFLDEVIKVRNEVIIEGLEHRGFAP